MSATDNWGSSSVRRERLEVLHLQVSRIAETAIEPGVAHALLAVLDTMTELPEEFRMLSVELSDLEPEPEKCQNQRCDKWALSGEFFCIYHV